MPPFDFQLSPETQQLLDLIRQQSQQQELAQTEQAAQPVEPPDTKQQIDNAVLQGANPQRPSRLLPQAPNPLQNQYQQAILANKLAYAAAEQEYKAAQDEAVRQGLLAKLGEINKAANTTRDIGTAAGMDLSAVGEGVSLQDATKNLATQQAQAVAQMATGRYSMTTDQFWQSEYDRHMMAGTSDGTARRRASRAAREYRAKRMAYLNGLYNNYGRDGLVTNELGNQILLNLAADDPTAANFYGQIYPNAKDAYARQNKLEDDAIAQTNAFANMAEMYKYNMLQALNNEQIRRGGAAFDQDLAYNGAVRNASLADELNDLAYSKKVGRASDFVFNTLGLDGDDAKNVMSVIVTGKELPKAEKLKFPKEALERANAYYNSLSKDEESLLDLLSGENAERYTNEQKEMFAKQLQTTQARKAEIGKYIDTIMGLGSSKEYKKYSGDKKQDLQTIAEILQDNSEYGANDQEAFNNVLAWVRETDPEITEWYVQNLINEAIRSRGNKK